VIAEQLAELQKESDKLTGELVLNAMRAQRALENFDVTPGVSRPQPGGVGGFKGDCNGDIRGWIWSGWGGCTT